jgi:hypothetical protein
VYLQGKPLIEITARNTRAVLVHQLSKQQTQNPFRKHHGRVVRVLFHPQRPFLFVATKMHVRVYNLAKQQLAKKLMTSLNGISSMAVHPGGMYKNSFYSQVFVFIKRASLSRASKRTCFVSFLIGHFHGLQGTTSFWAAKNQSWPGLIWICLLNHTRL